MQHRPKKLILETDHIIQYSTADCTLRNVRIAAFVITASVFFSVLSKQLCWRGRRCFSRWSSPYYHHPLQNGSIWERKISSSRAVRPDNCLVHKPKWWITIRPKPLAESFTFCATSASHERQQCAQWTSSNFHTDGPPGTYHPHSTRSHSSWIARHLTSSLQIGL